MNNDEAKITGTSEPQPIGQPRPVDSPIERSINTMDTQKTKRNKKPVGKIILTILIGLVLIGATADITYIWRDKVASDAAKVQADKITSLEKQLAGIIPVAPDTFTPPVVVCTETAPAAATIDSIKASITSGNTAALAGYMATSLNVVLTTSIDMLAKTPTQAVAAITDFISSDMNSWDYNFALPAATLNAYKASGYKIYFTDISVVGKATNGKVISFSFDCNSKIDAVLLSPNDTPLASKS